MRKPIVTCMALALLAGAWAAPAGAKTRLTLYWHEAGPTAVAMKKVIAQFEKENRDISIAFTQGPGDWKEYYNKFLLMMAAGTAVDLAQITMSFPAFAYKGVFADLTPFSKTTKLPIPRKTMEAFTAGGKVYGIPWGVFTNPMIVNKGLFEAAGVPFLPQDWDDSTFTRDQFVSYGKKLTKDTNGDGRPDQYGVYDLYGAQFEPFGASWLDPTSTKATANSKEMVEAWGWITDLVKAYRIKPAPADIVRLSLPWNAIATGKIGMNPFGNWGFATLKASKLSWDVGVTPKGAIRTNEFSVDALAMGARAKNKKEAWRFIEFLYGSNEHLNNLCMTMAAIPTVKTALPGFLELSRKQYPNVNWKTVVDAVDYGSLKYETRSKVDSSIMEGIISEQVTNINSGRVGIKQGLDLIQDRLTKELARRK